MITIHQPHPEKPAPCESGTEAPYPPAAPAAQLWQLWASRANGRRKVSESDRRSWKFTKENEGGFKKQTWGSK